MSDDLDELIRCAQCMKWVPDEFFPGEEKILCARCKYTAAGGAWKILAKKAANGEGLTEDEEEARLGLLTTMKELTVIQRHQLSWMDRNGGGDVPPPQEKMPPPAPGKGWWERKESL